MEPDDLVLGAHHGGAGGSYLFGYKPRGWTALELLSAAIWVGYKSGRGPREVELMAEWMRGLDYVEW